MRFLLLATLVITSVIGQTNQPKITEVVKDIQLSSVTLNGNLSFRSDGSIISTTSGSSFTTKKISAPNFSLTPFVAIGIKVKGVFLSIEDLSFSVNLDNEAIQIGHGDEDYDPQTLKNIIVTPLLYSESKIKDINVTITFNKPNITISGIEIIFINPGKSVAVIPEPTGTEDTYPKPPVVSRTGWGCPQGQSSGWTPSYTTVTHLIIHHTAGSNSITDFPAAVRSIWQYHTFTNGWGDIGYNYLIDPNGVIYEGRAGGDNAVGAHFCGTNGGTMGISMMGNYSGISPSAALLTSATKILAWKADQRGINPLGTAYHASSGLTINNISGHRVGCSTDCPGEVFVNHDQQNVRLGVLALIQSIAPKVVLSTPSNGTSNFMVYNPVKLSFSYLMDTASVRSAISISPSDTFTVSFTSLSDVVITPKGLWGFSTNYTIKVDTIAKNIYGTPLDGDGNGVAGDPYFLSFTTSQPDNNPPQILKYFPAGADVSTYAEMMILFDEEIANYQDNIILSDGINTNIPLSGMNFTWDGVYGVLTFKTSALLTGGTNYLLKIKSNLSDKLGNKLPQDFDIPFYVPIFSFTEGTVVDRFEGYTTWGNPLTTVGTIGVDSLGTSFNITSEKKRGGTFSGKLSFLFSGNSGGKLVHLKATGHLLPIGSTSIGFWAFGNLSSNKLSLVLENAGQQVIEVGLLNFYGWDFINIPFENSSGTNTYFKGFIIDQMEGAEKSGSVYFDNLQFNGIYTGIDENDNLPDLFTLSQNFPNPFNPETKISFNLPKQQFVTGIVYDILGREIATILKGELSAGSHSLSFDASKLSSGVYIFRLYGEIDSRMIKMIVTK